MEGLCDVPEVSEAAPPCEVFIQVIKDEFALGHRKQQAREGTNPRWCLPVHNDSSFGLSPRVMRAQVSYARAIAA